MRVGRGLFLTLVLLFAASLASPAAAQGTVRGVLVDSLRTGKPVEGAEIALLGTGRRDTTDSRGRFQFDDVAPGPATVAFWALWLDSLALPVLERTVTVQDGRTAPRVLLATPSAATFQRTVCGGALAAGQGVLLGEIRDPGGFPLAAVPVNARWNETLIGPGRLERSLVATVDTSDANGMFALCGVPVGDEVAFRAVGNAVASGELILAIGQRVQRHDLLVARAGLATRITGRILDEGGNPLVAATVALAGDTTYNVRSDANGRFAIERAPRRSSQLIVRSVGHTPLLRELEPYEDAVAFGDIALARLPQELAAVRIDGGPVTADQLQFETRRSVGRGKFVSDADLARVPVISATIVASMVPGATSVGAGRTRRFMLNKPSFGGGRISTTCQPRFFEDGYPMGALDAEDEDALFRRAKRVEVYTAAEAPPKYNDFDGCGVVLVWTR